MSQLYDVYCSTGDKVLKHDSAFSSGILTNNPLPFQMYQKPFSLSHTHTHIYMYEPSHQSETLKTQLSQTLATLL